MEFYFRLLAINMHVFVSGVLCMAFVLCTYGVECTYFPMRPIFLDSKNECNIFPAWYEITSILRHNFYFDLLL